MCVGELIVVPPPVVEFCGCGAARPTKGCGTLGSSSARLPREVRRPARACFLVEALARSSRNPGTPSICAALNVRDDIPVSVRTGGCGHRRLTPIASYGPTERSIGVSDGEVCAMGLVVRTDSDREGRSRTWGSLPQ